MSTTDNLPLPWVRTPLIESAVLSHAAGCRIFLKLENLQPSGSFKSRGLGNLIRHEVSKATNSSFSSSSSCSSSISVNDAPASTPLHFLCSSGGNAGLGAIGASLTLGQKCTVVVPESTKASMIARLRAAGATDVIQHGASWREADDWLRANLLAGDPSAVYVPPFDHELVWAGNAGIVAETAEQMGADEPDAIVCSVGGGGLFCGIAHGVRDAYASRPTIVAVETKGCDSLAQSLEAGEPVTLPAITSLATSLGATRVAQRAYELATQDNVRSVVVDDATAAMGCWRFADDHRTLVELACGASVCLTYNGMLKDLVPNFGPKSKVVIVVCGGANISLDMLQEYKGMFADQVKQDTQNAKVASTHTDIK